MNGVIKAGNGGAYIEEAINLCRRVFVETLSPLYGEEGSASFFRFLEGDKLKKALNSGESELYIMLSEEKVCSAICVSGGEHISLCFTDVCCRRRGYGRAVFERIITDYPTADFTVNSSPLGYEFYKALGFVPTDMEIIKDGIIFTPMLRKAAARSEVFGK